MTKFKFQGLLFAGALTMAATASQAAVVFDNMTAVEAGTPGAVVTATSSTPNTFMGDAYGLAAGTTSITGFDFFPVNLSGTAFTQLKMNVYIWGTVNTGTVNATTPAFSNLLSTFSVTSAVSTFPTGSYFSFESASPGVTPGITLNTPINVTGSSIGFTMNVQGSTDGLTFASVTSLSSLITYGAAPTVGSTVLGGAVGGYYRNANSEVNGNFTSTLRSVGTSPTSEALALRVYGTVSAVPEASTWLMMGLGLAAIGLLALRRQQR